ncbi:hypothetical protein CEY16_13730 [Halalkalibacillus sediminis]|uniref:DUF664 domain-containing protein n=1 Tax=Halalkalibacillus sediminis TaxID=2018042 RepID=A0A2I0QRA6_9BACI|nr:DinB family protein [Halalkalibacillus sediminis]PKR76867.1 hypothetical protein CEY16_13730 [Halalkalibacillus sediminis]
MINYRIKPVENYSEKIGELISMLTHTREVTLSEIKDLRLEELDRLIHDNGNTIGAILKHIAAIEAVHQVISFERRDLTEAELKDWKTALELGETARHKIKSQQVEEYIKTLENVRKTTLSTFKKLDDEWLYKENTWHNGIAYNNYYLWFHVMEDEINHRGQIRLLKRRLRER